MFHRFRDSPIHISMQCYESDMLTFYPIYRKRTDNFDESPVCAIVFDAFSGVVSIVNYGINDIHKEVNISLRMISDPSPHIPKHTRRECGSIPSGVS